MSQFNDDAARFATTREVYAHYRANLERDVCDLRAAAVPSAVKEIVAGRPHAALDIMTELLDQQAQVEKIRPLDAIPGRAS